jgi:hypothetical protein
VLPHLLLSPHVLLCLIFDGLNLHEPLV